MTDDLAELTPALRKALDGLTYRAVVERLGPTGDVATEFYAGQGYWKPGDGTPAIVLGPAEGQAVGRCVASRVRFGAVVGLSAGAIHPEPCGWCEYPTDELLRSLDHAAFRSRFVVGEMARWPFRDTDYVRSTDRVGTYEHPEWARFFEGDAGERIVAVRHAAAVLA